MAVTRNRPLRCIRSFTPSVGKRRWLYRLKLQCIDVLYNKFHNKSTRNRTNRTIPYMPCTSAVGPSPPGVINTSLPADAVYTALADRRCALATFSKSRVWDKVPERSTLIFGDTPISIKHVQRSIGRWKPVNQLDPCITLHYITLGNF